MAEKNSKADTATSLVTIHHWAFAISHDGPDYRPPGRGACLRGTFVDQSGLEEEGTSFPVQTTEDGVFVTDDEQRYLLAGDPDPLYGDLAGLSGYDLSPANVLCMVARQLRRRLPAGSHGLRAQLGRYLEDFVETDTGAVGQTIVPASFINLVSPFFICLFS